MASKSRKPKRKKKRKVRLKPAPESQVQKWKLAARGHFERGEFDKAGEIYRRILKHDPDEHSATHNLGVVHHSLGDQEKALELIDRAIEREPASAEYHFSLGNVFVELGRTEEGEQAFLRAIELEPAHAPAYNNLGVIERKSARFREAEVHFRKVLEIRPDVKDAHQSLIALLLQEGRHEESRTALKAFLNVFPDNPSAKHMLASLVGETTETVPSEYVTSLFDGYAQTFDAHLTRDLHYHTPELLRNAAGRFLDEGAAGLRVLDLGCGTGLCGPLFRDPAETLIGVDLSPGMLAKAQEKNVYDELIEGDLTDALRAESGTLDLVVSADVFVYVGALREVFAGCAAAIRPGGLFAFSVESCQGEEFVLRPSGRYAHSTVYIRGLASEFGFSEALCEEAILRTGAHQPITGHIFVLTKGFVSQ
jgi:predicted TPR repeat methyltransferase